jgi:protoporphyrinogen oxidase
MSKQRIVILGGGPAGLAAGWKLAEQGHDVTVLERDEQVGGQSITVRRGDWRFDLGGHRFFTKYRDVLAEVEALMGDDRLVTSRKSVIRLNDQYIQYPLELGDLLSRMNPLVTVRAGFDYFAAALRTRLTGFDDESFEDWIVNRFGRTLYRIYFGIYTEKLWGIPGTQISADWAAQRISLINLWDVFLRLLGRKDDTPRTYLSEFIYPRWGIGTIPDRMAERITAAGGRIVRQAEVKSLKLDRSHISEVQFLEQGSPQSIQCDAVIATIPLPELVESMGLASSAEDLRTVRNLRFRALRFLNLTLDFPAVTDNTWIYVPEERYTFFRVQEPRNWSPYLAPEGKTSLILELACNRGDALWAEDEEALFRRCLPQLVDLGLLRPDQAGKVLDYFSTYMTHAYPIYDLTYKQKIDHALRLCDRVQNLVTIGRQGLFRYNNMDHSLKMGFTAAANWGHPEVRQRIRAVASEQEGFEDQEAQAALVDEDQPADEVAARG